LAPSPRRIHVVTVFLTRNREILLLKRSGKVGSFRGCWAGVSGYLDADDPLEQAWVELGEELGIGSGEAALAVSGRPFDVPDADQGRIWVVHPFRFALLGFPEITLDWEHVARRWCAPKRMLEMTTVPGLWDAWRRVSRDFEGSGGDRG
jgi:8-oxo-dGTP diphosphatase